MNILVERLIICIYHKFTTYRYHVKRPLVEDLYIIFCAHTSLVMEMYMQDDEADDVDYVEEVDESNESDEADDEADDAEMAGDSEEQPIAIAFRDMRVGDDMLFVYENDMFLGTIFRNFTLHTTLWLTTRNTDAVVQYVCGVLPPYLHQLRIIIATYLLYSAPPSS